MNNNERLSEYDALVAKAGDDYYSLVKVNGLVDRMLYNLITKELFVVKIANKRHRFKDGEVECLEALQQAGMKVGVWVGGGPEELQSLEDYREHGVLTQGVSTLIGNSAAQARWHIKKINNYLQAYPQHPDRAKWIAKAEMLNSRLLPMDRVEVISTKQAASTLDELEKAMNETPETPEQRTRRLRLDGIKAKIGLGIPLDPDEVQLQQEVDQHGQSEASSSNQP